VSDSFQGQNHWRGIPALKDMRDFEYPKKKTRAELIAENERLLELAAKYWVLRDAINWHIASGKRLPRYIRLVFEAQMEEINETIGAKQ
jgi:hypothetical protein